jgi:hypothetical protein
VTRDRREIRGEHNAVSCRARGEKLHKAVDLFVRAVDDFSVIHPWAKQRHNSSYKNETQDWNSRYWPNNDFAGSWLHIYPYRYPNNPNAEKLKAKVSRRRARQRGT